jgi:hypothetical protein
MNVYGNPSPPKRARATRAKEDAMKAMEKAKLASDAAQIVAANAIKIATAAQKEIDAEEAANNPVVEEPKAKPKAKAKAKKK